jgi:hypothetical protein
MGLGCDSCGRYITFLASAKLSSIPSTERERQRERGRGREGRKWGWGERERERGTSELPGIPN